MFQQLIKMQLIHIMERPIIIVEHQQKQGQRHIVLKYLKGGEIKNG